MKKVNIGILGASSIAHKRFLPALKKNKRFNFIGIASRNIEKAQNFVDKFGGRVFQSYEELINDIEIDAVYIPLPPKLHFEWAKKALEKDKHILMEKPFTNSLEDTEEIISLSNKQGKAIFENYMFIYHRQLKQIDDLINSGQLGEIRLIRTCFGFPFRGAQDFRYDKSMGGGALLDCGGYPIKLASHLLGNGSYIAACGLSFLPEFEVDIAGHATIINNTELTAQVAFGMDNAYKCELEIWGSKKILTTQRIFSAPEDLDIDIFLRDNSGIEKLTVEKDDHFYNSLNEFYECINNNEKRYVEKLEILNQAQLVEGILKKYEWR